MLREGLAIFMEGSAGASQKKETSDRWTAQGNSLWGCRGR
jgi:hypothetical protein